MDLRAPLPENYLRLVRNIAYKMSKRSHLPYRELVSAGSLGLMQAVSSFDRSLGVRFITFAYPRVRGAMLDELRREIRYLKREGNRLDLQMVGVKDIEIVSLNRASLQGALKKLLGIERKVIELYYLEDLTLLEIAEKIDRTESGTLFIKNRALKKLREALIPE